MQVRMPRLVESHVGSERNKVSSSQGNWRKTKVRGRMKGRGNALSLGGKTPGAKIMSAACEPILMLGVNARVVWRVWSTGGSTQWPGWSVIKCVLNVYCHKHEHVLKKNHAHVCGWQFYGIWEKVFSDHFHTLPTVVAPVVSHALVHTSHASLITISKSIPDIFRLISRRQVTSTHYFYFCSINLLQSLEICIKIQCTLILPLILRLGHIRARMEEFRIILDTYAVKQSQKNKAFFWNHLKAPYYTHF